MATETNGAEAGGAGLPQLDVTTFPNQIFWLVLTLLAIYFILDRIALPRIGSVLAERQGTITGDLAAAEELKAKADEAEAAYEKALADARAEAQKIAAERRAEIQTKVDAAVADADATISKRAEESEARIAEIRARAMEDVRSVAVETAPEIVSLLGGDVDTAAVEAAVVERMKG
ncbi:MAG: F0F1 ATP synthase subunit B' [Pseudomonadota bacterium]